MSKDSAFRADSRYSRQERYKPFGVDGQKHLSLSTVLIVGAGALGSAIAETLTRAGTGHIKIVDRDYVEWSNLQRQQLYTERDADEHLPKSEAARRKLQEINSEIRIEAYTADVRGVELEQLAAGADLIMDGTDNFETRLIINDISQKLNIPWIYGGCVGSSGMTYTFLPGETPCLHCLLGTIPLGGDTCDTSGILPQAVQMTAAYQTMEAMKLLAGHRYALAGRLKSFDLWKNENYDIKLGQAKKENCPSCGVDASYPYLSQSHVTKTEVLCGRDTVQIRPPQGQNLNLERLAERLREVHEGGVRLTPFMVMFEFSGKRLVIFSDGRALIHGTSDLLEARTLYTRYVG